MANSNSVGRLIFFFALVCFRSLAAATFLNVKREILQFKSLETEFAFHGSVNFS